MSLGAQAGCDDEGRVGSTVMVVLLAQLSDTHLLADPTAELWGHNTTLHLTSVMDSLPSKVDVIVATGDLVEDGSPDAYRRLLALTEGRAEQRHFVAGNHDNPSVMRTVLGSTRPLEMVRISDRWTLALVDSQWVGHDAGQVSEDTLGQLRDDLAQLTTHVVLGLHHPPLSPCCGPDCGLSNGEEVRDVIQGGPVRIVLSGHVHQHFDTTVDGVRYLGAPSTFRQLRHGGDPHYTDTDEPPAAQLVELRDDGEATRQIIWAH